MIKPGKYNFNVDQCNDTISKTINLIICGTIYLH